MRPIQNLMIHCLESADQEQQTTTGKMGEKTEQNTTL